MTNGVLVGVVLGAILSIPINLLVNLATPRIQSLLELSALSSREKKLKRLESEYERLKELYSNPTPLYQEVAFLVVESLAFLLVLIAALIFVDLFVGASTELLWLKWFLYLLLAVGAILVSNRLSTTATDLVRIRKFEKYEAEILAQIKRVQGKAETRADA